MQTFGIYSAGGFAREVRGSLVAALGMVEQGDFQVVFIDDDPSQIGGVIHGSKVVSYEQFKTMENKRISIAFAAPTLRKEKAKIAAQDGIDTFSITAPNHILGDNVAIGRGAILASNSMITADAKIGDHFHCNIYSYVAHDCTVGDFVTFAPRVSLNGRVIVEDMVYIGSDATILPGKEGAPLVIGEGAVIGAGAVVTKSVPSGAVMVGNPARQRR